MLKITTQSPDGRPKTLTLEGRLAGPWVAELERVWKEFKRSSTGALVVDLTGVTFVETQGKALLSQIWQDGAELLVTGCCMRSLVDDIASSAPRRHSEDKTDADGPERG